jgi:pimeloyl-ACP methyl ester carboxylesterase
VPRTALTLRVDGVQLVGTHHAPAGDERPAGDRQGRERPAGLLLINPGMAPRSGNSDLAAKICDALAARGVHAFRFDMPGLGDSDGPVEADIDVFWANVCSGRNDAPLLGVARTLRQSMGLRGLVVGGLCAGAVTAIQAGEAQDGDGPIVGLLLLEPSFRATSQSGPASRSVEGVAAGDASAKGRKAPTDGHSQEGTSGPSTVEPGKRPPPPPKWKRAMSRREWLFYLTGNSAAARACTPIRPWLLGQLRRHSGSAYPKDTNVSLANRWVRTLERGMPTHVVMAKGHVADYFVSGIREQIPASVAGRLSITPIEHANHILTSGDARQRTVGSVVSWFEGAFGGVRGAS